MTEPRRAEAPDALRKQVEEGYADIARRADSCCGGAPSSAEDLSRRIGYSDDDLRAAPEGANLGLGCGNPTALDSLRPGEVVLDLGSGAGFDSFLAARQVGPNGRVIGVDMTDAMLDKARENARKAGLCNVEFRKGTIEELPVEDESVDAILSNCVINLSPEKDRVFREAYRVLRSGGRLMISDVVLERPLPSEVTSDLEAYLGCVAGASLRGDYLELIRKAGFREIEIAREQSFAAAASPDDPQVAAAAERCGVELERVPELLEGVTSLSFTALK